MLGSSDSNLSDPASSPSHSSSELSNTAHSSDDGLLQTLSPASFSPITDSASSPSPPPSRPRPVLQRRHRDIFNVIWSGSLRGFGSISLEELFAALGLWTREDENLCNFLLKHREFFDIFKRVLVSRDPSELCTHPLLHNPLNLIIEETLTKYDSAFHPIRQGIFPSASFDTRSGLGANAWGHLRDLDGPGCVQDIQHMDSIFSSKKDYITASMPTKSRKLAQGLLWGFHFSYSAIRNSDPRESPLISQNLELALTLFKASIASVEPKDRSALADRYFQSLILARTVVLYEFLDSLPCNLSPDEARKESLSLTVTFNPSSSPEPSSFMNSSIVSPVTSPQTKPGRNGSISNSAHLERPPTLTHSDRSSTPSPLDRERTCDRVRRVGCSVQHGCISGGSPNHSPSSTTQEH